MPAGPPELLGVDESATLLARFTAAALGSPATTVRTWVGRWPDVAERVPPADVVVCANVVYNVPDVAAFVAELTAHARRRVVVELTTCTRGPRWAGCGGTSTARSGPPARRLRSSARCSRNWAWPPSRSRGRGPIRGGTPPDDVVLAFTRRRLCLPVAREPE
ncbi:hypothetical protein A7K94_0211485, partial [Modestobacter sp. VKM Ac-2676]